MIKSVKEKDFLKTLGLSENNNGTSTGQKSFESNDFELKSYSPVDGKLIGNVSATSPEQYEEVMQTATAAFKIWRQKPAPLRGEIVRQFGEKLSGMHS